MVKKITVNCNFNGGSHPVAFYIGDSAKDKNPINFQSRWLSEVKGGKVPTQFVETLNKIKKISDENNIPFEDLYDYVVKEIENGKVLKNISLKNTKNKKSVEAKMSLKEHEEKNNKSKK